MGSIYKITNTVNGKSYIGQTIQDAVKTRIRYHFAGRGNQLVKRAIEKYGQDAFTYEILYDGIIPDFLDILEIEAIAKFNTLSPHGYNLTTGGEGGSPSDETRQKHLEAIRHPEVRQKHLEAMRHPEVRQKLSKASTGKRHTDETRRKMSESREGAKNPMYGKPRSDDTKRKISEANTGKKRSDEVKQKLSEARKGEKHPFYGKSLSEEHRRKLSEAHKRPEVRAKHSESMKGENSPMYGKSHTEETRRKMSESHRGKKRAPFSAEHRSNIAESKRSPEYIPAHNLFFSLPSNMALKEKRRLLCKRITGVKKETIYHWIRKWTKDA